MGFWGRNPPVPWPWAATRGEAEETERWSEPEKEAEWPGLGARQRAGRSLGREVSGEPPQQNRQVWSLGDPGTQGSRPGRSPAQAALTPPG